MAVAHFCLVRPICALKWPTIIAFGAAIAGIGISIGVAAMILTPTAFPLKAPLLQRITDLSYFAVGMFLIPLSYFLYRGRSWARVVLIALCLCIILALLITGITAIREQSQPLGQLHYQIAIAGFIVAFSAVPLFLIMLLRHPDVVAAFRHEDE